MTNSAPIYLQSRSVLWRTPLPLFDAQVRRWGPFWVDVAASRDNALCPFHYDEATDGLAPTSLWRPPTPEIAQLYGRGAFLNGPYRKGEEACLPGCKKRRCVDPEARNYRGHHLTRRVASLGEWMARARDEAIAWGGPVCTVDPERPDTQWWKWAIRHQPESAGRFLGGEAHPNGGPAAPFFPLEYPTAEWRVYRWENLTVDIVIIEGRVDFGGESEDTAGATFPSAIVTFYRPEALLVRPP